MEALNVHSGVSHAHVKVKSNPIVPLCQHASQVQLHGDLSVPNRRQKLPNTVPVSDAINHCITHAVPNVIRTPVLTPPDSCLAYPAPPDLSSAIPAVPAPAAPARLDSCPHVQA